MFDIRKIQEQVIFNAVKTTGSDKAAAEIVYGKNGLHRRRITPRG